MGIFLETVKKIVIKALITLEKKLIIPCKIQYFAIDSAIVEEVIYDKNTHGFTSCVLFCHYNKHGLILEQVKELCLFFQSQRIDVIFVTTKVSSEARLWLEKNLSTLIIRKNFGRDFGAWKDSISFLKKRALFSNCSQLYLINDSILLLENNLRNGHFQAEFVDDNNSDMIGLTESWQKAYHLQSYCLKFNQKVTQSECFSNYWDNYYLINSRRFSIENGEIGLTQMVLKNGYKLKSLYPLSDILKTENLERFLSIVEDLPLPEFSETRERLFDELFLLDFNDINPSHRLWPLIVLAGCPVLKRDLIEKNPDGLLSMKYFMYFMEKFIDNDQTKELLQSSLLHIKYQSL
jgi:hypothetical protein